MKYYILKSFLIYDGISDEKIFCPRSLATAVKILHSLFIEVCTLYTVFTYKTIPSREWFTQSQSQEGLVKKSRNLVHVFTVYADHESSYETYLSSR